MFEHGALHPINESGKSIVHAHLHIFPNDISLLEFIAQYNFGIKSIDDISSLQKICVEQASYLYYSDIDGRDYIMSHEGIPSQFLRKILADSLGTEKWNWREEPFLEVIEDNLKFYKDNSLIYNKRKRSA